MSSRAHIVRYLENRLSACRALPALHSHQIAVYERLLDLARGAADAGAYHRDVEARGLILAVTRAEWLDRYRNAACVYAALGDEAQRAAAAARFHAGQHPDFLAAITAIEHRSAAGIVAARASQEALAPLLLSLLSWRVAGHDALRRQGLREVHGLWRAIQHGDPGCTWERICAHPPYRSRIPFDDAGLAVLGAWLAEALAAARDDAPGEPAESDPDNMAENQPGAAVAGDLSEIEPVVSAASGDQPAAAEAPPAAEAAPAAPGPAQAYRIAYRAQDFTGRELTRRAYERILALEAELAGRGEPADYDAFLCRMAEDDLLDGLARAPHLDWAEQLRAHGAGRSQPVLAHHAAALAAAVAACPTATAVEHERMWLDACFDVESAWDQLLVHFALSPIAAVLSGMPGAEDAARASLGAVEALFGATWDALLATPRLWAFFCDELVPAMFGRRPNLGAYRGEAGAILTQAAVAFTPLPAGQAPEDVRAHVAALLPARATPAPERARALALWGRPVALDALADALAAPPRPAVALGDSRATAMSALYAADPP